MTQLEPNDPSKVNTWLSQWWRHGGEGEGGLATSDQVDPVALVLVSN